MNRRHFLSSLGLGAAGLVATSDFDWERLLWRPKPIITVPAMPSPQAATVRVFWADGVFESFGNVSFTNPDDLFIGESEWHRVLDKIDVEFTHPLVDRQVVMQMPNPHKGLQLHSGNTLTVQWAPNQPLIRFES